MTSFSLYFYNYNKELDAIFSHNEFCYTVNNEEPQIIMQIHIDIDVFYLSFMDWNQFYFSVSTSWAKGISYCDLNIVKADWSVNDSAVFYITKLNMVFLLKQNCSE